MNWYVARACNAAEVLADSVSVLQTLDERTAMLSNMGNLDLINKMAQCGQWMKKFQACIEAVLNDAKVNTQTGFVQDPNSWQLVSETHVLVPYVTILLEFNICDVTVDFGVDVVESRFKSNGAPLPAHLAGAVKHVDAAVSAAVNNELKKALQTSLVDMLTYLKVYRYIPATNGRHYYYDSTAVADDDDDDDVEDDMDEEDEAGDDQADEQDVDEVADDDDRMPAAAAVAASARVRVLGITKASPRTFVVVSVKKSRPLFADRDGVLKLKVTAMSREFIDANKGKERIVTVKIGTRGHIQKRALDNMKWGNVEPGCECFKCKNTATTNSWTKVNGKRFCYACNKQHLNGFDD
jgi:hypothetical protein